MRHGRGPVKKERSGGVAAPTAWKVLGSITHDRGPVNLWHDLGLGNKGMAFDVNTQWRLRCWDADDGGKQKQMYLRGVADPTTAFHAATVQPTHGLQCASDEAFTDVSYGAACLPHNNGGHTYYAKGNVMWALYSHGGAYTLRHCGPHGGGRFSPGEISARN